MRIHKMGTLAYLSCFLASLLTAMLTDGWRTGLALALSVALALVFYPRALQVVRRPFFWVFSLMLLASGLLWVGEADTKVGIFTVSLTGLETGVQMAFRAAAILIAMRGLAVSTSPGELAGLLERLGMKGLGFAFGVAVNLLPALEQSSRCTLDTLRMRGGFRRQRWRAARLALLTIMSSALRRAEEITLAAETRGFSPTNARPLPLRKAWVDVPVAVGLLATVVLLVM